MLATITSHAPLGIEGEIISVEVDLRNGIPGIDIVGLPDGAVKEAKERVRVAIRNSGFVFPPKRILVNLAPAGIRKEGAIYDLSIAIAILSASDQIPYRPMTNTMVLGELNLSGSVRPVRGVLSAVGTGLNKGIKTFIVPENNLYEALALGSGEISGVTSVKQAAEILSAHEGNRIPSRTNSELSEKSGTYYNTESHGDLADIKGHSRVKRAPEIAAAGKHNLFLFGPPGSGKAFSNFRCTKIEKWSIKIKLQFHFPF